MRRLLPYLAPWLAFAALVCFEQDYLWTAQEQSLFLHTKLFFQQSMVASGGLLSWAGAYLTQFFYYPMLGAGILCLLWAFLMLLLKQAFRLPRRWMLLTLIPVGMLLLADVQLGYWVYFLKLQGHLYVATLGFLALSLLVWAFNALPLGGACRPLFVVAVTVVGYPLLGFYALLAALLMALLSWRQGRRGQMVALAAVLSIIAVPLIAYWQFYHQTPLHRIAFTALPVFVHNGVADAKCYLPYVVLVAWLVVAALSYHPERQEAVASRRGTWFQGFLLVAMLLCIVAGWQKDDNFHRELAMRRQMEQHDWKAMLTTIKQAKDEPTRAMSMMKNLALQRTGRLQHDMAAYPDGFRRPAAVFPIHTVHTIGKMLYLQYGIPNYCYRWCMEDGVEYGWNVEALKLMTKCSLINGETTAAQRYLSLLKRTDFHRQWAMKYEAYLRQPSLMAQDAEFKAIAPLLRTDEFLTSDQSQLEPFLIEHLASAPGDTPEQRELRAVYFRFYFNRNRYVEK